MIHLGWGAYWIKGSHHGVFHFSIGLRWFWGSFVHRHRCVLFILGPLSYHWLSFWITFASLGFKFLSDYPLSVPSKTCSSEKMKGIAGILQNCLMPAPILGAKLWFSYIFLHYNFNFPTLWFLLECWYFCHALDDILWTLTNLGLLGDL